MQAGTEQFIRKDYGFYDSMTTAVVGIGTVTVYEVLRRYVWREGSHGGKRLLAALKRGVLASRVTVSKLSVYTGISIRQIHRHLKHLRDLGWVRDVQNKDEGRAVVFELGRVNAAGEEQFFADEDVAGLWGEISKVAETQGLNRTIDVICAERLGVAMRWYDRPSRRGLPPWHTPSATLADQLCHPGRSGVPQGPPEYRTNTIEKRIENQEYVSGASAPEDTSAGIDQRRSNPTGPEQDQDLDNLDPSDENIVQDQDPSDPKNEEERPEIALDTSLEANDTRTETLRRMARAADAQKGAVQKSVREGIVEKDRKNRRREINKRNLEGAPPEPDLWSDLKRLWKVWEELVSESFSAPPSWLAKKGDIVGRKQAEKLLGMYGYERTRIAVTYAARSWDTIGARFFKSGSPPVLNIGFIHRFHEQLFRESELWSQHEATLEEWTAFWRDNPKATRAPAELRERHDAAMKELSSLGLGLSS